MKKYRTHLAAAVLLLTILAVVLLLRNRSGLHSEKEIRNVIMISLDTTRADMWGFYGNEWIQTPNLDALAKESVVLDDFMTVVPTTLASHTSLFTGKYPLHHGVPMNGYIVNEQNLMLAEILRERGFFTAAFIGSFALDSRFHIDQGFDIYEQNLDMPLSAEREQVQRRGDNVTDAVINTLKAKKASGDLSSKPLFLFAHYFDPHHPYDAPQPFGSMYRPRVTDTNYAQRADLVCGERHADGYRMPGEHENSDDYAGEISYLDVEVGRLLEYLRAEGLLDTSLLVITSDHGEQFWEHAPHFNHGRTVYESVARIVGMIRFPDGRYANTRYTPPAANIDILPTVLREFRIAPSDDIDGLPLNLNDPKSADLDRPLFCEATQPSSNITIDPVWPNRPKMKSIRRGKYKYTWTPFLRQDEPPFRVEELFDLEADPCEQVNLLDKLDVPEIQQLRNELREELIKWSNGAAPLDSEFDAVTFQETHQKLTDLGYLEAKPADSEADESAASPISNAPAKYSGSVKHVVLVSFDTTRPDHFGAYGNEWIDTPALDALASEGIVFESARTIVPGTLTAHASLFTGTFPHTHGTPYNGFVVNDDNITLAELLKGVGFSSKGFAAAYPLNLRTNINQGFDVWNQDFIPAADGGTGQRTASEVTASVLKELDTNGIPENLFLFVHYFDPHSPYLEIQPWFDRYLQMYTSREETSRPMHSCPPRDGSDLMDLNLLNAMKYASEISSMDAGFGALIEGLKSRGIYEDALVIVISDHAENFWEHEVMWDHGETIYDTSSHIVCVARMPGGKSAGTRVKGIISNVDIAPSILNAMGLPIPSRMEGQGINWSDPESTLSNRVNFMEANQSIDHTMKLASLGNREAEQARTEAKTAQSELEKKKRESKEVPWPNLYFQRGITDGRYKLVVTPYRNTEELYDLATDPCEYDNLLKRTPNEEILKIAETLREKLTAWDRNARPLGSTFDPVDREKTINELREMGYF